MCFDKMDYYYEKALEAYCQTAKKSPDAITDEDQEEVERRAGNHIGLFLTWLIRRDLIGELHQELPEVLDKVKTGELLGVDFFQKYCDGKFWDEDVAPEALPFVTEYYGQYFENYVEWVLNDLCDLPLEFVANWEDYLQFEPLLDRAYRNYRDR